MFSTGAGLPGVKLHNICGKSFFPTPLFALVISTSAFCLPIEVFIWNRCPFLTQTIFLPVERVLHYCFHFPQSQSCLPPKSRMKRGKLTWGGRSHHWSVRLSCCSDWPSLLYSQTSLMLFASESAKVSPEMRRLHFVKIVDVVTPMSLKLTYSPTSFCPGQRTPEIEIWKKRPFQTKWAFSTIWTSWSLSSLGWPDMVSMFLEIMFFQLFASYPSVGLLVERNDFFLVGVAAGSVAIFFTSEWIGKNLLQFVPIYNRW